jgi:group I intron endonuclease
MRDKYYIYILQNVINNKIYVGESNNPINRIKYHKLTAKTKKKNHYSYIHEAIDKYGEDNFTFDVIEEFQTETEALEAETFWIQFFRSWDKDFGYNKTLGNKGIKGFKHSNETLQIISQSSKGRKRTPESINKMIEQNSGDLCSSSKITDRQALEIIHKYGSGNYTYKELAIEYNISPQQTNRIVLGKRRKHLNKRN